MAGKGKALTVPVKEVIVNCKSYFEQLKKSKSDEAISSNSASALAAQATGFSLVSVQRVMKESNGAGFTSPNPK
ncbi:MAG: hypothetical protein HQL32_00655, partial [Planctomycetes bacterium]|nr:hypothetical protein [Planctomycetota bacterium]